LRMRKPALKKTAIYNVPVDPLSPPLPFIL
jgi:hypothetical protein